MESASLMRGGSNEPLLEWAALVRGVPRSESMDTAAGAPMGMAPGSAIIVGAGRASDKGRGLVMGEMHLHGRSFL